MAAEFQAHPGVALTTVILPPQNRKEEGAMVYSLVLVAPGEQTINGKKMMLHLEEPDEYQFDAKHQCVGIVRTLKRAWDHGDRG